VIQGPAAAAGLGAVLVCAQPLFHAIKWAGVAYLPPRAPGISVRRHRPLPRRRTRLRPQTRDGRGEV